MNRIRHFYSHLFCLVLVSLLCIQVPVFAYSYGDPSAEEQEHLEYINRARANPNAEVQRTGIPYLNEGVPSDKTISSTAKQPLVFNAKLSTAAAGHSQDMLDRDYFAHETKDSNPIEKVRDRVEAQGYDAINVGENLAFKQTSDSSNMAWKLHEALFIDEGVAGRGHRVGMLRENTQFKEIGIGLRSKHISGLSHKYMITVNFGKSYDNYQKAFLLGVVYDDSNNNDFYTAGEGISGITITISGEKSASTTTATAGGYAIYDLPSGNYSITFSHNTHGSVTKSFTVTDNINVKVDVTLDEFSSNTSNSIDNADDSSGNDSDNTGGDNTDSGSDDSNSNNTDGGSDNSNSNTDSGSDDSNNSSSNNSDSHDSSNNASDRDPSNTSSRNNSTHKSNSPPPQPSFALLNISSGQAHIISQPVGIDCKNGKGQCSQVFKLGTVVQLFFAEELPEYLSFDGWNGDSDCRDNKVTLNKTINCAARIYGRVGFEIPPATNDVTDTSTRSVTDADDVTSNDVDNVEDSNHTATDSNNTADSNDATGSNNTADSNNVTGSNDTTDSNDATGNNNTADSNDTAVTNTNNATDSNSVVNSNSAQNDGQQPVDNTQPSTGTSLGNNQAQAYNFSIAPYTQLKIINSNSFGDVIAGTENDLITGFVLAGTGQQNIMLRAQPHTMGMLPTAKLCQLQIVNNQWTGVFIGQTEGIKAISQNLGAGAYTVQTNANQAGFAQLGLTTQTMRDDLMLTNVSTRGFVQSQVAHQFVLQGAGFQKVLITGLALTQGINPAITLLSGSDHIQIMSNDDWEQSWQQADLDALSLSLDPQEAAILAYLHAGTYTVVLTTETQGLGMINIELIP